MRWLVAAPIQPWGGWRFTKRRWQSESYIARSKLGVVAPVTVILPAAIDQAQLSHLELHERALA
jgi:hypothetical protein